MRAITYAIILTTLLIFALIFTQAEASDKCGTQERVTKYLVTNSFIPAASWRYYDGKIVTIWGDKEDRWVLTTTEDNVMCLTTAGEGYVIHGRNI